MVKPQDKTILIVDDEPDIVVYLKTLLEDAGFNVMTALDGDEALEKVKEHAPDLISLDLVMPKKSGIRCYYELRKNKEWAKIKVIVVTAHARDDRIRNEMSELFSGATLSGPQTYLEKPVHPQDYVNLIKRELGIEVTEQAETEKALAGLRDEVRELVARADRETLAAVMAMLKGWKK
ncbi:MAG: response regulator [Deltaproteobacteria bacterium]|nr:response regulator [Deltaproteobacteria bacterium]MCL5276717.1 response regulator [Deltaproteobacteria bacterium]